MSAKDRLLRVGPAFVTTVLVVVGLYDVAVGGLMLLAEDPRGAHGPGTLWSGVSLDEPTMSLFRRGGAFSFHAGVSMVVWAWLTRDLPRIRLALMLTCLLTGVAFFATDQRYFSDTAYLVAKQVIGAAFFSALVVHVAWLRAVATAAPQADGPAA